MDAIKQKQQIGRTAVPQKRASPRRLKLAVVPHLFFWLTLSWIISKRTRRQDARMVPQKRGLCALIWLVRPSMAIVDSEPAGCPSRLVFAFASLQWCVPLTGWDQCMHLLQWMKWSDWHAWMRWMKSVVVALGKGKTEKKKEAGRNKKEKRRRKKKERRKKQEGRKKNKEERARPKLIHFHLPIARPRRKLEY